MSNENDKKDNTARLTLVVVLLLGIAFAIHVHHAVENDKKTIAIIQQQLDAAKKTIAKLDHHIATDTTPPAAK